MTSIKNAFVFSIVTLGLMCGLVPEADAGCDINYSIQTSDKRIMASWLQVKSRGGVWKRIKWDRRPHKYLTNGLKQRGKYESIYSATFGCKAKRRYKFTVIASSSALDLICHKEIYYPSATGWTRSTDINFGDIARHCNLPPNQPKLPKFPRRVR